jgi:hypothetical protein
MRCHMFEMFELRHDALSLLFEGGVFRGTWPEPAMIKSP